VRSRERERERGSERESEREGCLGSGGGLADLAGLAEAGDGVRITVLEFVLYVICAHQPLGLDQIRPGI